jgi:hypothetical protein
VPLKVTHGCGPGEAVQPGFRLAPNVDPRNGVFPLTFLRDFLGRLAQHPSEGIQIAPPLDGLTSEAAARMVLNAGRTKAPTEKAARPVRHTR